MPVQLAKASNSGFPIEFTFPAIDCDGRHAVADEVPDGEANAHEVVDPDEQSEGSDRDRSAKN